VRLSILLPEFFYFSVPAAPRAVIRFVLVSLLVERRGTSFADIVVVDLLALELTSSVVPFLLAPVALDPVLPVSLGLLILRVHLITVVTIVVLVAKCEACVTVAVLLVVALVVFLPLNRHLARCIRTQQLGDRLSGHTHF